MCFRVTKATRDLSNRVYASDEARTRAMEKAEKVESSLGSTHPSFVRTMLPSHVTGGFWLGLSSYFCKKQLPRSDGVISLVDEEGEEWPVVYLARKCGLSGGWKKFAVDHELVDGDALVFQRIQPTVFKVYITRVADVDVADNHVIKQRVEEEEEGGSAHSADDDVMKQS